MLVLDFAEIQDLKFRKYLPGENFVAAETAGLDAALEALWACILTEVLLVLSIQTLVKLPA